MVEPESRLRLNSEPAATNLKRKVVEILNTRGEKFMAFVPLASYILHPRHRGRRLEPALRRTMCAQICGDGADRLQMARPSDPNLCFIKAQLCLRQSVVRLGPHGDDEWMDDLLPSRYWASFRDTPVSPLGTVYAGLPASTGDLERVRDCS